MRRIVLAVLGASAAGVLALWLDHLRPTELPGPTGAFALGRTSYTWDDIGGWLWYPAAIARPPMTICRRRFAPSGSTRRPAFINFLTRDLARVRGHSAGDVAISNAQPQYPVAILRAGGSGSALNFSSLAEDLASHGYIVVGLDIAATANPEHCAGRDDEEDARRRSWRRHQRHRPCNRSPPAARDSDVRFVEARPHAGWRVRSLVRWRTGRAVLLSGYALQGRHRYRWPAVRQRDHQRIPVPFMFLLSDHGTPEDAVSQRILSQIQGIYDGSHTTRAYASRSAARITSRSATMARS